MIEQEKLLNATCPECRGPLTEWRQEDGPREYVCLVGHRYSARALLEAHSDAQEKALWSAVVALEEAVNLTREVATQLTPETAARVAQQSAIRLEYAQRIRDILQQLEPFRTD